ncbi:hypothetical protein K438DRAFT_1623856, partial [Mycena galopus ATCC 62051]
VTGASGFLGSWIAYLLLEAGHSVKGTTRGIKMELVKTAFAKYSKFEAVAIPEVASGNFESLFRGVHAVFHTAAAIPGRESHARNATVNGSLNVLKQADSAGVRNVVVTSSLASFPPTGPFGAEGKQDRNNAWILYCAEKAAGDQAVLAFADAHPWMNVSIGAMLSHDPPDLNSYRVLHSLSGSVLWPICTRVRTDSSQFRLSRLVNKCIHCRLVATGKRHLLPDRRWSRCT